MAIKRGEKRIKICKSEYFRLIKRAKNEALFNFKTQRAEKTQLCLWVLIKSL